MTLQLTDEQIDATARQAASHAEELADDVIHDIARGLNIDYGDDDQYIMDFARSVIAADRVLQSARHAEELAAYALTVSNLRAQGMPDAVLKQALEATQTIRDFGAVIAQDGYKVAGENLVQTALVIERAMLSSAPAPQPPAQPAPQAQPERWIEEQPDGSFIEYEPEEMAQPAPEPERKPMIENIRQAQIIAGEDAVIVGLRAKGLIP